MTLFLQENLFMLRLLFCSLVTVGYCCCMFAHLVVKQDFPMTEWATPFLIWIIELIFLNIVETFLKLPQFRTHLKIRPNHIQIIFPKLAQNPRNKNLRFLIPLRLNKHLDKTSINLKLIKFRRIQLNNILIRHNQLIIIFHLLRT